MKNYTLFLTALLIPIFLFAQEQVQDSVVDKPQRPAFDSSFIIDNPTDVVFNKGTLEAVITHRFGLINGGTNDLKGLWAPSNIRIAVSYSPHDRLNLGFGTTKFDRLQDFNWKVALLRQTRSDKIPVNVSYYGNFTIDARGRQNFALDQHRYSNFHQLIISRRFSPNFSFQVAPSVSHYNVVEPRMRNDVVAVSAGGRLKISSQTSLLLDFTQPFVHHLDGVELAMDPEPGFSLGVEFSTSAHAFQIFITNYNGIVPQKNIMFNQNNFFDGDILIGFNITRLYNF